MTEPTVTCPSCRTEFRLTEQLAAPLIEATRKQYEKRIADKEREIGEREAGLLGRQKELEQARAGIDAQVAEKVSALRAQVVAEESRRAREAIGSDLQARTAELAELRRVLAEHDEKLAEAQKAQADLMRKQRELDDARREIDLTIERKVGESLASVREKAKLEAEDSLKLKVTEKEEQIASMQRQIEELRRRAEQGSQQLQGEAFELELEGILRSKFPGDLIEPVPKGEFGGDVLQRVVSPGGQVCGTILWETKRTKNWSDGWLVKLREDQRAAKAEFALLISTVLPKGVDTFDQVDGVWVTQPRNMVPVALALRQTLLQVASSRQAQEGQQTKMELVYQYLTGPRFRHRIEAIVEKFGDMQADLERERKTMTRLWAKREEQIRGVVESTVGMYGDLQGIAGRAFQEIENLDVMAIESSKSQID